MNLYTEQQLNDAYYDGLNTHITDFCNREEYIAKMNIKPIEIGFTDDLERKWFTQEQMDQALAEQHKNTRNDAIEKINSIYLDDLCEVEYFFIKITGSIMNLKQRKPELK